MSVTSHKEHRPSDFLAQPKIRLATLRQTGLSLEEKTFVAIGGGLGSFTWIDHLRIQGADPADMLALGFEAKPYARCRRLCHNSQIPDHERLRSDSGATPDNIWGWPGYAIREAWHEFQQGNLRRVAALLWQIFTEPVLAETFTPKAIDVFTAVDRESRRIGWDQIWRFGRVQTIRQTTDGRYLIVYTPHSIRRRRPKLLVASYLHLALGYPRLRFLPDLQAYRAQTNDFQHFINAYEPHEHIYTHLRRYGGTILLRGRGIVASRIIQRLSEEQAVNPAIQIFHLMRHPQPLGNHYHRARRLTRNHFTHQPFNFPKSCFGGDLMTTYHQADDQKRVELLKLWGGTTTAQRTPWEQAIETGLNEGWYQIQFGEALQVEQRPDKLAVTIRSGADLAEQSCLLADFIIDATGLDANFTQNPLLADLAETYQLPQNSMGQLNVDDDFVVTGLENGSGRVYASGVTTLGGPFAPVDSFTGLQYAAQCSIASLLSLDAPGLQPLTPTRSIQQWLRWAWDRQP